LLHLDFRLFGVDGTGTLTVGNSAPDGLAIKQFDTATTTAADNWWGAADGPAGAGSGSGDGVGASIGYTPFLTSQAAPCAPDATPVPTFTLIHPLHLLNA
jgi:hypothetical protein